MRSTCARWRRSPCSRSSGQSLEQIDAVERTGAQVVVLAVAVSAARVVVAALDVDGPGEILGGFGGLERAVFPLRIPVLDVHLLHRAVKVLDLDGAVVVIE